jgi:hypothetical protein
VNRIAGEQVFGASGRFLDVETVLPQIVELGRVIRPGARLRQSASGHSSCQQEREQKGSDDHVFT